MIISVLSLCERSEKGPKRLLAMNAYDAASAQLSKVPLLKQGNVGFPKVGDIYAGLFGNRFATVGYGGPLCRQLIHETMNKIFLPAEMLREDANAGGEI